MKIKAPSGNASLDTPHTTPQAFEKTPGRHGVWTSMTRMALAETEAASARAARLRSEIQVARQVEKSAVAKVSMATDAETKAEADLHRATIAVEELAKSHSSAATEQARARAKVEEATSVSEVARQRYEALAPPSGASASAPVPPQDSSIDPSGALLRTLSDRDLNEVRRLPKPPQLVRRALELVQAMLAVAEQSSLPSAGEVQWGDLQKLLAREDFIKRVLALQPMALSMHPEALTQIGERWPSLKHAVGTASNNAPHGAAAWRAIRKGAVKAKENRCEPPLAPPVAAPATTPTAPKQPPKDGTNPAGRARLGRFAAVAVAAVAEAAASDDPASVTVEAVEYASRPCGAIFRWCANCACWKQ